MCKTIKQLFNALELWGKTKRKNPNRWRVYSVHGISPTIYTYSGGNLEPLILIIDDMKSKTDMGGLQYEQDANGKVRFFIIGENGEKQYKRVKIRKFTPRECFRLQDVDEHYIDAIANSGISKSQQYKLAGNSITVAPMYHIFRKLFIKPENDLY